MSNPWLPRDPAHASLDVSDPEWVSARGRGADLLVEAIDGVRNVEVLTSAAGAKSGYFRVRTRHGPDLFVKVLNQTDAARQQDADRIARFVARRGVGTSRLVDGFPRRLSDGRHALAYPLVEGRFSRGTEDDLRRLGATLGRLHVALRALPGTARIRAASLERHAVLWEASAVVASRGRVPTDLPSAALDALRQHRDSLAVLAESGQVVHGDLNCANVLFDHETGNVTILDFEEALSAWFPPAADVAFALERFALRSPDATAMMLARALLRGYGEASGSHPFRDGLALPRLLRALNVRALAVLVARRQRGDDVPRGEWAKFTTLLAETYERRDVLAAIEQES